MYSKSGRGCNGEEFKLEVERGPEGGSCGFRSLASPARRIDREVCQEWLHVTCAVMQRIQ